SPSASAFETFPYVWNSMSKNFAELNQGPGSYRVLSPQIVCATTSPIMRAVYQTCSMFFLPFKAYCLSTQSPTAYTSAMFVSRNSLTSTPCLTAIPESFNHPTLG